MGDEIKILVAIGMSVALMWLFGVFDIVSLDTVLEADPTSPEFMSTMVLVGVAIAGLLGVLMYISIMSDDISRSLRFLVPVAVSIAFSWAFFSFVWPFPEFFGLSFWPRVLAFAAVLYYSVISKQFERTVRRRMRRTSFPRLRTRQLLDTLRSRDIETGRDVEPASRRQLNSERYCSGQNVVMCEDCGGCIKYRDGVSNYVCDECGRIICKGCSRHRNEKVLCRECANSGKECRVSTNFKSL